MSAEQAREPGFKPNDRVRVRAQQSKVGVVLEVRPSHDHSFMYQVFFSSSDQPYVAEADLLPFSQIAIGDRILPYRIRLDDLRREILLAKLRSPHGESLYSLRGSRVEFQVYQFKPVLKLLRNPDQRLLIADEVGLGKTIEAGIIMTELQARVPLNRVLVVCPASLRAKWQTEMRSRFEETFQDMDAGAVQRFLDEYGQFGEAASLKGIVSIELLRRSGFIDQITENHVHFDLVIIDEAHHCRNPETNTNELATALEENADAMLLLTATPLALGNPDLFHLLKILSPGEFSDLALFEERIKPNQHVNSASRFLQAGQPGQAVVELKKVERTSARNRYISNPYYREVLELLKRPDLDREQALRAQGNLLELNTLSHIFTRTRKRDVVTDAPLRDAKMIRFDFSDQERAFYDAVVRFVRQHWHWTKPDSWSVGFALVMRERQAASCIPAFRDHYASIMTQPYLDAEDLDMVQGLLLDGEQLDTAPFPSQLQEAAKQLIQSAKRVGHQDTKFDLFLKVLRQVIADEPEAKVIVFSFFKKTLEHLRAKLQAAGIHAQVIHGDVAVYDRHAIIERFRETDEIRVLLSSEVGSEGIDLQFCHVVFNYDLPWNPMKVEQRIGRVDRFGQKSRKISIYSFAARGTIEDRIYARLYERIRIFEESIGDLEAILGEALRDLARELYCRQLTPQQEIELADRAARTILQKKQDLEELDRHRLEFMGQDALFEEEIRAAMQSGRYVSQEELYALVSTYLESEFPRVHLAKNKDENTWCLEPTHELLVAVQDAMYRSGRPDSMYADFVRRLIPLDPIPLTFSDEIAYERKLVEFVTLRHPLARMAVAHWQEHAEGEYPVLVTHLQAPIPSPERLAYFLFGLRTEAVRVEEKLVSVVVYPGNMSILPSLSQRFLKKIEEGQEAHIHAKADLDLEEFERARGVALEHMTQMRDAAQQEARRLNDALVSSRLDSLEQTYNAKIDHVKGLLDGATDTRIRRMRQGQLTNLRARLKAANADLESRRVVTTTFSLRLAGALWFHPQNG